MTSKRSKSSIQVIDRTVALIEALPCMRGLHDAIKETVNLAVRQGDEVVYVERVGPSAPTTLRLLPIAGARAPLHVTAVGKVFLADSGADAAAACAQRTRLPRATEQTLTDASALAAELSKVRTQGFATEREEAEKGVSCIGAGIRDISGHLVAGRSVSAPSDRLDHGCQPGCAMRPIGSHARLVTASMPRTNSNSPRRQSAVA